VRWVDDPDSRVDIVATAREDLRGVLRRRAAERRAARPASGRARHVPRRSREAARA
jgi:hypothetical protein